MFLPTRRVRGVWIALVLLGLTPLSAIAGSPEQKFQNCCVWRVTNAEAPFYLVGSIHALSKKDYPPPSPYELALRESKRIVLEFDPSRHAEFERKFEAAAKYPPGQDIRSEIDSELFAWLRLHSLTDKADARHRKPARDGGFETDLRYKQMWIAQHSAAPASSSKSSAM